MYEEVSYYPFRMAAIVQTPRCVSYKKDGFLCNKLTIDGVHCGVHHNSHIRHIERFGNLGANQCECVTTTRRCTGERFAGSSVCIHHFERFRQMRVEVENRNRERDRINQAVQELRDRDPRPTWKNAIRDYIEIVNTGQMTRHTAGIICRRYLALTDIVFPTDIIQQYWDWVEGGEQGPEPQLADLNQFLVAPPVIQRQPQPQNRLAAITRDRQNVHTREVSEQTNKSTEILLNAYQTYCAADKHRRTPDWVAARWLPKSYGTWGSVARVVDDMQHWYGASMCRSPGDRLYKKLLDGLYETIKAMEHKDQQEELFKRMFEECNEAVGMCCEGHISRLCNVMVGFDDQFQPPIPVGELLQQRIGKIAMMEVPSPEKISMAQEVFNELKTPEAERLVWLEALEGY